MRFTIYELQRHLPLRFTRRSGRVPQTSKSAVSQVSKPASRSSSDGLPIWKSAIQQVWKPAIRVRLRAAFTLVELLVVIAIIGILSAMLLLVITNAARHATKTQARLNVSQIANAIEEYNSLYGHMPVSDAVQHSGSNDVTYGGAYNSAATAGNRYPDPSASGWGTSPFGYSTPEGLYITSNSDVIAILADQTNYPNTSNPTVNAYHKKNPRQKVLLNLKFTGDTASPGIGTDLNCRDPWGNPYLITMDLNDDNKAEDPFYAPVSMSSSSGFDGGAGVDGLSFQSSDDHYLFHGNVMVWSMGPDGPVNHSPSSFTWLPASAAPSGAWAQDPSNKNHILSWDQ
jgi:prepilin-type N-terminal cleavage/methylation domain-containing protein